MKYKEREYGNRRHKEKQKIVKQYRKKEYQDKKM